MLVLSVPVYSTELGSGKKKRYRADDFHRYRVQAIIARQKIRNAMKVEHGICMESKKHDNRSCWEQAHQKVRKQIGKKPSGGYHRTKTRPDHSHKERPSDAFRGRNKGKKHPSDRHGQIGQNAKGRPLIESTKKGLNQNTNQGQTSQKKQSQQYTPKMIKDYLNKVYGNQHLLTASGDRCNFASGMELRKDFDNSMSSCQQNYSEASTSCNASSDAGLNRALKNIKSAISEVQSASSTSVHSACQKYTDATSELTNALDSFTNSCDPAQVKCQETCYGTNIKSEGASMGIAKDPFCGDQFNAMLDDISDKTKTANGYSSTCSKFQGTVTQASNDARELTNSQVMSRLCSNKVATECEEGSSDPSCQDGYGSGRHSLSEVEASGTEIKGPKGMQGFDVSPASFGKRAPANTNASARTLPYAPNSLGSAALGLQQDGVQGLSSDGQSTEISLNQQVFSAASTADSEDAAEELKEEMEKLDEESTSSGKGPLNTANSNPVHLQRKKELRKYLPGGASDPEAELPDGITTENGKSLFEKVSSRYSDHRANLNSFSQQVNLMNKEDLKARTSRKMSLRQQQALTD